MTKNWSDRAARKVRNEFKALCADRAAPCWLCGQPIDYSLDHRHPMSFVADHFIPKKHRPDLMLDPDNLRPAHAVCNKQRGLKPPPQPRPPAARTRRW